MISLKLAILVFLIGGVVMWCIWSMHKPSRATRTDMQRLHHLERNKIVVIGEPGNMLQCAKFPQRVRLIPLRDCPHQGAWECNVQRLEPVRALSCVSKHTRTSRSLMIQLALKYVSPVTDVYCLFTFNTRWNQDWDVYLEDQFCALPMKSVLTAWNSKTPASCYPVFQGWLDDVPQFGGKPYRQQNVQSYVTPLATWDSLFGRTDFLLETEIGKHLLPQLHPTAEDFMLSLELYSLRVPVFLQIGAISKLKHEIDTSELSFETTNNRPNYIVPSWIPTSSSSSQDSVLNEHPEVLFEKYQENCRMQSNLLLEKISVNKKEEDIPQVLSDFSEIVMSLILWDQVQTAPGKYAEKVRKQRQSQLLTSKMFYSLLGLNLEGRKHSGRSLLGLFGHTDMEDVNVQYKVCKMFGSVKEYQAARGKLCYD